MTTPKPSLIKQGALLEAKAGTLLATGYCLLFAFSIRDRILPDVGSYFGGAIGLFLFVMLPVALFGGISGAVIGFIFSKLPRPVPNFVAVIIGLILPLIFVLLVARPDIHDQYCSRYYTCSPAYYQWRAWKGYLYFPGLPALIYILASGWVGFRLNQLKLAAVTTLNPSTLPTPATGWNIDTLEYIRPRYLHYTRYELDLYLINTGCEPTEIETAWKQLEVEMLSAQLKKKKATSLGEINIGKFNARLTYWKTLFGLVPAGFVIYLLPFFISMPLVIIAGLVGSYHIRESNRAFAGILIGTVLITATLGGVTLLNHWFGLVGLGL